jgi:hypothetical protein
VRLEPIAIRQLRCVAEEEHPLNTVAPTRDLRPPPSYARTVLTAAWLAVLLGFAVELFILLVAASSGTFYGLKPIVADVVRKVSWSTIVCVGLAFAAIASSFRSQLMGLAGLLSAPAAFMIANALHKATAQAISITLISRGGPSPLLLALIKGVEYACLGALLGWVSSRFGRGAPVYILIGLATAVVFGGAILVLTYSANPDTSLTALIPLGANELIHPVGCSLVLLAAQALGGDRGVLRRV